MYFFLSEIEPRLSHFPFPRIKGKVSVFPFLNHFPEVSAAESYSEMCLRWHILLQKKRRRRRRRGVSERKDGAVSDENELG